MKLLSCKIKQTHCNTILSTNPNHNLAYHSLSSLALWQTHLKTDWIVDNHWALQELKYDWEAEISVTKSRSKVEF